MEWLYEPPTPRKDIGMTYIGKVSLIDGTYLDTDGKISAKVSKGWGDNLQEELWEIPIDAQSSDGIFQLQVWVRKMTFLKILIGLKYISDTHVLRTLRRLMVVCWLC